MNVVLYGDSNTYGYDPVCGRFENRYSNLLKDYFTNKLNIYEEGLIGRTTIYDDYRPKRKSIDYIYETLFKYETIDLLVLMLGTNDLKKSNAKSIKDAKLGMEKLLNKILRVKNVKNILIISPILLAKNIKLLDDDFDDNSYVLSKCLSNVYEELAINNNLVFFDAKKVAKAGKDGQHLNIEGHQALALNLEKIIEKILL